MTHVDTVVFRVFVVDEVVLTYEVFLVKKIVVGACTALGMTTLKA